MSDAAAPPAPPAPVLAPPAPPAASPPAPPLVPRREAKAKVARQRFHDVVFSFDAAWTALEEQLEAEERLEEIEDYYTPRTLKAYPAVGTTPLPGGELELEPDGITEEAFNAWMASLGWPAETVRVRCVRGSRYVCSHTWPAEVEPEDDAEGEDEGEADEEGEDAAVGGAAWKANLGEGAGAFALLTARVTEAPDGPEWAARLIAVATPPLTALISSVVGACHKQIALNNAEIERQRERDRELARQRSGVALPEYAHHGG